MKKDCQDCLRELDILRAQVHELDSLYKKKKKECDVKIANADKLYYEYQELRGEYQSQNTELKFYRQSNPDKTREVCLEENKRMKEQIGSYRNSLEECQTEFRKLRSSWRDLKVDLDICATKHRYAARARVQRRKQRVIDLNKMIERGHSIFEERLTGIPQVKRGPLRKKPSRPRSRRITFSPTTKKRSTHRVLN